MSKNAVIGRRYADKLVQLYRKDDSDEWVLAHVEVQGQKRKLFPERMYTYNYWLIVDSREIWLLSRL